MARTETIVSSITPCGTWTGSSCSSCRSASYLGATDRTLGLLALLVYLPFGNSYEFSGQVLEAAELGWLVGHFMPNA